MHAPEHRTAGCTQSRGDRKVDRFAGPSHPAIRSCRSRMTMTRTSIMATLATSMMSIPPRASLVVNFDGRAVTYGFGELDMLVPAYAATIHKTGPGISGRGHSGHDAALRHAAAEPRFIRASLGASGWWCWSDRRRPSPSRCANVSGRRRWSKLAEWLRPKSSVSRQFGMMG